MYQTRRTKLANMLPENAILFVLSGKAMYSVGDEMYPFSVNRSFYYLTGLDRDNMMYILVKQNGRATDMLVIERFDEMMGLVGNKELSYQKFKEEAPIFDGYDKFLEYCFEGEEM